jgi:hypothetical protein
MRINGLSLVSVKQSCNVSWNAMTGTDTVRHCEQCDRTIHNLSAMTAADAERLLAQSSGERLCVTYARGPSGEVVTTDRPARFSWGRLGGRSTAAAAALTLSMSTSVLMPVTGAAESYQDGPLADQRDVPRGGLRGTIRVYAFDDPLDDAAIKAVDQKTGEVFATQSAKDGSYALPLPKGRYDVTISVPSFTRCTVEGVDITNRMLTADAKLEIPPLGETLVVGKPKTPGCNNKKLNHFVHKK